MSKYVNKIYIVMPCYVIKWKHKMFNEAVINDKALLSHLVGPMVHYNIRMTRRYACNIFYSYCQKRKKKY